MKFRKKNNRLQNLSIKKLYQELKAIGLEWNQIKMIILKLLLELSKLAWNKLKILKDGANIMT